MAYGAFIDGQWAELTGAFVLDDIQHPAAVLDCWSAEELAAIGVLPITEPAAPAAGQRAIGSTLDLVEGEVVRSWVLEAIPTPEGWATARAERNRLLSATDWTQLPDAPLCGDSAVLAYRQALRDLPEEAADPFNITWPESPL